MRRLIVANLLVLAVLASAAALAYYGWRYSAELASRERELIEASMRALAEEKVTGIETHLVGPDEKVFDKIDFDQPRGLQDTIADNQAAVVSAFLLDGELQILPSGYHSKREHRAANEFRDTFVRAILPTLPLRELGPGERGHVHDVWEGEELVFSFARRVVAGKNYYVVLETDLKHLLISVFPQFLSVGRSPYLYQVVDADGQLVFGMPFRNAVVELPFVDTVDRWRLRVAPRDEDARSRRDVRNLIDLVLIGLALGGIVTGLGVLLLAMRRERKANELKSDFISNVSHELKTPLSIISMFGEMLALGRVKTPAQATEYAEIIWRESVRLARLIDNVLDFAKIERGKDVYEFGEGDVAEVVGRAIELSSHRLQQAGLDVETDVADELPPARIDANAYTLAVMNLIDNAIKYAPGGGRLAIRVRREGPADEPGRIVLEVQDFGEGIDPAEHDRIFERFYRARAVRLRPIRGSGIGLALVDHIARAHGGGVWVKSTPGQGATFGLWIPAAAAAEEPPAAPGSVV